MSLVVSLQNVILTVAGVVASGISSTNALAVADSVYCIVEMNAPLGKGSQLKSGVFIEGLSQRQPLIAFYGHQVMPLAKTTEASTFAFDAQASRFHFRLDRDRLRLVVRKKQNPANNATQNGQVEAGLESSGAGNCKTI